MDYIIDMTVRTKDYKLVDKTEGITPQKAISILVMKYSIKWNDKIQSFYAKEMEFEQRGKKFE